MTLDEAIKHAEEVAEKQEKNAKKYPRPNKSVKGSGKKYNACIKCAKEHRQLAEWLRELKFYKNRQHLINKSWQKLIQYREGIEKIKMRSQAYRECGETVLASGIEQALDILMEVTADDR